VNTLSLLIYFADIAVVWSKIAVIASFLFVIIIGISTIVYLVNLQETDIIGREIGNAEKIEKQRYKDIAGKSIKLTSKLLLVSLFFVIAIPSQKTIVLIAASEIGEKVLTNEKVVSSGQATIDPSIELLKTWILKETEELKNSTNTSQQKK
jgi:hypothetical protein